MTTESGDMGLSISLSTFWSLCVLTELLRRIFSLTTGSSGGELTLLPPTSLELEEASRVVVVIPLIRLLVLIVDGSAKASVSIIEDEEVKDEEVLRLEVDEVEVVVVVSVAEGGVEVLITSSDV